jgi:hypothetical protein
MVYVLLRHFESKFSSRSCQSANWILWILILTLPMAKATIVANVREGINVAGDTVVHIA